MKIWVEEIFDFEKIWERFKETMGKIIWNCFEKILGKILRNIKKILGKKTGVKKLPET